MKSVQKLPQNYVTDGVIDISNRRLALALNVLGLAPLALFGWIFFQLAVAWRPEIVEPDVPRVLEGTELLYVLFALIIMLVIHELIHGAGFWLFTGDRPVFGLHPLYAYAAAPGLYLSRNHFLIVGLAPFVLITVISLAMLNSVPGDVVPLLLIAMTVNAGGSVGDFIVAGWLVARPNSTLIKDTGPQITAFVPAPAATETLARRWRDLMASFDVEPDAAHGAFQVIYRQYTSKVRHYHTIEHVARVLDTAEGFRAIANDFQAVQLAIWFHDIVYDPRGVDNEVKSAEMAKEVLTDLGLPEVTALKAARLILCTISHLAPDGDVDAQILIDADLSSLAADEPTFREDSDNVRLEFSWVSDREYQASRVKFLSSFLARDFIYQTEKFREVMEPKARSNLTREIALNS